MHQCLKIDSLNENLKCALTFVVHFFKTHQNKVCLPRKLFQKFHDPKSDYYFEFISVFHFVTKKNLYTYTLEGGNFWIFGFRNKFEFSKGQTISKTNYAVLHSQKKTEWNSLSWVSSLLRIGSFIRFLEELRRP